MFLNPATEMQNNPNLGKNRHFFIYIFILQYWEAKYIGRKYTYVTKTRLYCISV